MNENEEAEGPILTVQQLVNAPVGTTVEDYQDDIWKKLEDGNWAVWEDKDNEWQGSYRSKGVSFFKPRLVAYPAHASGQPLCGAQDYGYSLDPDLEPLLLGPCNLPEGHRGQHSGPQPWGDLPVRWGPERAPKSPTEWYKEVFGPLKDDIPMLTIDEVPFGNPGLLSLHELVKEGRYYIQANTEEQFQYGCHECIDEIDVDAAVFPGEVVDVVTVLKWIERHEAGLHAPKDLNVQIHLTQNMTAYAQQAGKSPEDIFPEQSEKEEDEK
jgi:hypothetical protein